MKIKRIVEGLVSGGWLAGMCLACGLAGMAQTPAAHKTENVIVVMIDGLRWQDRRRSTIPRGGRLTRKSIIGARPPRNAGRR